MQDGARTVLVVDDETDIAELISYGLSAAGFHVDLVPSGRAAIAYVKRTLPDIILLDVMLPDMDGFTLIPVLRALSRSPVIFLTARSLSGDRARGLKLGAADYVAKPFDMDDLISRLRGALTAR